MFQSETCFYVYEYCLCRFHYLHTYLSWVFLLMKGCKIQKWYFRGSFLPSYLSFCTLLFSSKIKEVLSNQHISHLITLLLTLNPFNYKIWLDNVYFSIIKHQTFFELSFYIILMILQCELRRNGLRLGGLRRELNFFSFSDFSLKN